MGFLDAFKTSEEVMEETLSKFNIYEGIVCEVTFPDTQLKIASHGGLTRGVATLAFGFVGLAATSSIKHKEEKRKIKTNFQVVEKGIVFKRAKEDGKDLRIPYDNIVEVNQKNMGLFEINIVLLENQVIILELPGMRLNQIETVSNHVIETLNKRACGAQYEEVGWGLEHATAEPQKTKQESGSLMDELERLGNMYEKGLLTDEEFAAMKKKLIEGD